MRKRIMMAVTLGGLLLLAGQTFSTPQSTAKPTLAGSWELTFEPIPSSTTEPAFVGLVTFTSDGSAVETDTEEVALRATPAHGIWQPGPVFGHWYIRFTSLVANSNGTLHSKRITTITGTLNSTGAAFIGDYSIETVDPSGHALATVSGAVTGQLMVHPALP